MGKAVPRGVKVKAEELIAISPEKFSESFEGNKGSLNILNMPIAKSTRNLIAGFITRTTKQSKKPKKPRAIPKKEAPRRPGRFSRDPY